MKWNETKRNETKRNEMKLTWFLYLNSLTNEYQMKISSLCFNFVVLWGEVEEGSLLWRSSTPVRGTRRAWCLLNALSASERKTHTTLDKINTRVQAQKRMFPPEPFSSGQLPVLAATVKHGFIAYLNKMKLVWLENQYSWDNVYVSSMKPGIISTEVYRTIYLVLY